MESFNQDRKKFFIVLTLLSILVIFIFNTPSLKPIPQNVFGSFQISNMPEETVTEQAQITDQALITEQSTVRSTVQSTVQSTVHSTVQANLSKSEIFSFERYYQILRKECPKIKHSPASRWNEDLEKYSTLNCSKPFVFLEGQGRLGNQICQYLSLAVLQKMYGFHAALGEHLHRAMSDLFSNVKIPLLTDKTSNCPSITEVKKTSLPVSHLQLQMERAFTDKPNRMNGEDIIKKSSKIPGYPCLYQILFQNRHIMAEEVKLNKKYMDEAWFYLGKMLGEVRMRKVEDKELTMVSVHVRRGDYVHHLKTLFPGRTLLEPCYFEKAIQQIRKLVPNVVFIVTGSSADWNKSHMFGSDIIHVDLPSSSQPMLDLTIMSMCEHHIVSLGTFGFASAYIQSRMENENYLTSIVVHPVAVGEKLTPMEKGLICGSNPRYIPIQTCV